MANTGVNSYNSVYENIYASSKKEEVKKDIIFDISAFL